MAPQNLSENAAISAQKRANLRLATSEFRRALQQMVDVLGRCIESSESPELDALESEYDRASNLVCTLADSVCNIANALKVQP